MFKQTLIGQGAPLRFVQDSLVTLGSAMLPSMILLLGGNLSQGIITQLFGAGEEASLILLWCYLASVVTITFWTMVFIWLLF